MLLLLIFRIKSLSEIKKTVQTFNLTENYNKKSQQNK